ncbi:hypothetical protein AB4Z43_32905 [Mesorhizobium sp. 2RAF45]|uniref:hypothetical protein n=1 Tax=Mesorhizobium sp. 2RAF45 TaxID=3233001 RepID=UPI003F982230
MTELVFTAEEEARYRADLSLSTDKDGKTVLAGLTLDESIWLVGHNRRDVHYRTGGSGERPTLDDKRRAVELREKHEQARLRTIGFRNHVLRPKKT